MNPMKSPKKGNVSLEELAMPAQPVSSVKLQPTSPKVGEFNEIRDNKIAARVKSI